MSCCAVSLFPIIIVCASVIIPSSHSYPYSVLSLSLRFLLIHLHSFDQSAVCVCFEFSLVSCVRAAFFVFSEIARPFLSSDYHKIIALSGHFPLCTDSLCVRVARVLLSVSERWNRRRL